MTWTMMIVMFSGILTPTLDAKYLGFSNKEACVAAAEKLAATSTDRMGFICVSSETGEVLPFKGQK